MNAPQPPVPDLLRRFTPTPLRARFRVGETQVQLETNDPEILAAASEFGSLEISRVRGVCVSWKLIRESDGTPSGPEFSVVVTADLVTLLRGEGTVITVDCTQHEVLGFLARGVRANELKTIIFPFLANWCGAASASDIADQLTNT